MPDREHRGWCDGLHARACHPCFAAVEDRRSGGLHTGQRRRDRAAAMAGDQRKKSWIICAW